MLWTILSGISLPVRMTELCINLPSGGFLSASFSSFQACSFGLRVSSPQLAAASALSPVMWGPFSADASSINALSAVIIPYVIIMTESDPIKVLMYGTVCPSHI